MEKNILNKTTLKLVGHNETGLDNLKRGHIYYKTTHHVQVRLNCLSVERENKNLHYIPAREPKFIKYKHTYPFKMCQRSVCDEP